MALFSIATHGQLEPHIHQEWLLTNGLGGFSSSTVVGCNTRRYHGLLVAATLPPVGRMMALNRVGEILTRSDRPGQQVELGVNQFGQEFHPRGEQYLRRFDLDGVATWHYIIETVRVTKEVQILWGRNVTGIRYTIDPGDAKGLQFAVQPFTGLRDFHSE
ncbi:MAG TPA: glycogen debranching enzyme N-terminal domain-containing protein, partial [Tepidisphaeraceae bacterium]|nr:glycogen debranching enzyme N-terminal domain-containing protein [Tepidisphaeraceae bacterium]